jgi:hypothetical protein
VINALCSELALLLVAIGESKIFGSLLLIDPDRTLYNDDVGMPARGRILMGVLCPMSICLKAMSNELFEIVLPKPELSGDGVDFTRRLFCKVEVLHLEIA